MKNLIRGHIYQLKKDNFFFGCLALSFIFLIVTIRFSSLESELIPLMGIDSLIGTFLNGDIILYAFMLLTANMVAEAYSSGAMKNIIGRGISKKQYYLSIVFTISTAYLLVMLIISIIIGVLAYSKFGIGTILYPSYYALSIISRVFFCYSTYQLCSYNDDFHQKCNYWNYFRTGYSKCPTNFGNGVWIFENSY